MGWKIHLSAKEAHKDAATCAPIYTGTCHSYTKEVPNISLGTIDSFTLYFFNKSYIHNWCLAMKVLTYFHGKCFRAAKAMVIEGLRWAPEMWPVDKMTIITARPLEAARPRRVTEPPVFWFTIDVAVPAKINIRVPMNSAPTWGFDNGKPVTKKLLLFQYSKGKQWKKMKKY